MSEDTTGQKAKAWTKEAELKESEKIQCQRARKKEKLAKIIAF